MKAWSILAYILGVLLIALGIWCMVTPIETYGVIAWLIGLAMIVDGVANIANWVQLRKMDMGNAWILVGAIFSVVVGLIIFFSLGLRLAVDLFIAVMIAIWLIAIGVMRIAAGIRLRNIHVKGGEPEIGKRWWLAVLFGVLVVLVGILSLLDPIVIALSVGLIIGACIVSAGVATIAQAAS